MQRANKVLICTLTAAMVAPATADARHLRLSLPGVVAAPLRMMFGRPLAHHARHHHHARHGSAVARSWRERTPEAHAAAPAEKASPPARQASLSMQESGAPSAEPGPNVKNSGSGSPFWPGAYNDLLEPVLWPATDKQFWAHGYRDVLDGVFGQASNADETSCGGDTATARHAADVLALRLHQTVQPTTAQHGKLEALRTAFGAAFTRLETTCSAAGSTPPQRLRAVTQRLLAMRQALFIVRAPLAEFYNALDDAQKERLKAARPPMQASATQSAEPSLPAGAAAGPQAKATAQQAKAAAAQAGAAHAIPVAALDRHAAADPHMAGQFGKFGQLGLCAAQMTSAAGPTDQIERDLRPTKAQRPALEGLRMVTTRMGQFLAVSCPRSTPETPLARLDAELERLNVIYYAAAITNRPLRAFYGSLNDRQKARLRKLSPEGRTAAAER